MRGVLGRVGAVAGAIAVAGGVLALGAGAAATAADASSTTTAATSSTTSSTTTASTSTSTSTTVPPPLVIDLPTGSVTPQRGTQAQVTDTQPPPPTTTTTSTLPPSLQVPANSGEGRRIVYSKSRMRVWTVEADGTVSKTHLVSGRRTWNQPLPGTYSVFSRSSYTCNIKNPDICWRYMVRFAKGPSGDNIGFHEIPTNIRTGSKLQSVSQLGQALSGGCVRQSTPDAQYMWAWAPIGTKVVVLG